MRAQFTDITGRTVTFQVECSKREPDGLIGPPVEITEHSYPLKLMGVSENRAYYKINEYLSPGRLAGPVGDPARKAGV